jgi:serine phosphatase RsbU (regulator of sigma subunit)
MKDELLLIEKMSMCVYTDIQFKILKVNDLFTEYTQLKQHEIIGKNALEFFSLYNDIELLDNFLINLSESGNANATLKLKFGDTTNWVRVYGIPQKDQKNNIIGFLLSLISADAEKKLENIEQNSRIKEYEKDLEIAESYIKGLLPNPELFKRINPNAFLEYRPMRGIGGDWYWFYPEKERTLFIMGDVMGHGINAGVISAILVSKISTFEQWENIVQPVELLKMVHQYIYPVLRGNQNIDKNFSMDTLACIFYKESRVLLYSSANFPLLIQHENTFLGTEIHKQPLQIRQPWNVHEYTNHSFLLEPNDWVWAFSDGVKDQFDEVHQKPMGKKRLKELILQATTQYDKVSDVEKFLLSKGQEWMGTATQTDDIMLAGFKIA